MAEKINLKEIEKRSYRSIFQSGVHDIGFGVLLLSFAIAPLIREAIGLLYIPIVIIPAPLVIVLGTRYITAPRLGTVKFSEKRESAKKRMRKLSAVSTTFLLALLALTATGIFPGFIGQALGGTMLMVLIGVIVLIFMGIIAYIMDFKNMLYYGIVIGIGVPAAEILRSSIGAPLDSLITFGTLGSLLLIYGIVNLSRFLKKYPKTEV